MSSKPKTFSVSCDPGDPFPSVPHLELHPIHIQKKDGSYPYLVSGSRQLPSDTCRG